jgi:hypothetical protein
MAAAFAKGIALVDLLLSICRRTKKSWGSNLILANPGMQNMQKFIDDVEHTRKHAPLENFTMANLRAEGILTAKALFPEQFQGYQFDEPKYMWDTWKELQSRKSLGVDVSRELEDLKCHLRKYPEVLKKVVNEEQADAKNSKPVWQSVRGAVGDLGLRDLRKRRANRLKVQGGDIQTGFNISGYDFGFSNIVEGADALERIIAASKER